MPTSNPALSDKAFERVGVPVDQAGWAAPPGPIPPAPDVVSPWRPATPTAVMTVSGSITATAVLTVLLIAGGFVGWLSTTASASGAIEVPGWVFVPAIAAIGLAIGTIVKPGWARITAPLFAVTEGVLVGAISKLYEASYDGIVLQAAAATIGVLAIMLFLFATHIVEVTDKMRMIIVCATGAIALVYVFDFVMRLFNSSFPFLHDAGGIGILISCVIVVVAAMNLLLDFDFIQRGVAARAPKSMEWYAGFGLLITLVWLYLELLRLLSKLQRR